MADIVEQGDPERHPRRRVRIRPRSFIVAAVVVVAAGGYAALHLSSDAGHHGAGTAAGPSAPTSPSPTLQPGGTVGARLVGSLPLAVGPVDPMVLSPGAVWLASWTTGTLTRVAGDQLDVTARVAIGQPQDGPRSATYGGGALWVIDAADNSLRGLDPVSGRQRRSLPLAPWGEGDTVAYGGGFVWVACSGQLGDAGPRERLIRVDPDTLHVDRVTSLPGEGEDLTVIAEHADVWVGGSTRLAHLDVSTGRPTTTRVTAAAPFAVNGGSLWTYVDGHLAELDAHDGHVVAIAHVDASTTALGSPLVVDPVGRAWTPMPKLTMVRPTGFIYGFSQYDGPAEAVAVDTSTLWIYTGRSILRFDISHLDID
jgi:hypothetical protein